MKKCVSLIFLSMSLALLIGGTLHQGQSENLAAAVQQRSADPRLMSIEQLPESGVMCEPVPAVGLMAALQQEARPGQARAASSNRAGADIAERPPLRVVKDQYAAFSAVSVDTIRNEVAVADENMFAIMVYDRLENTPANVMTKPKRIITGGKTNIQFACGVYIDPQTGEIYGLNNDTQDHVVVFGREAKGDVAPDRMLKPPHAPFGIAANEEAGEFYLTIQHSHSVVVYRKGAAGNDDPIRLLQGNRTQLADPHGIALDTKNKLMFVSNHGSVRTLSEGGNRGAAAARQNWPNQRTDTGSGHVLPSSITVYPLDAQGDTAPLRVIQGPDTELNWPIGMAVDSERGELFVANDAGDSVLVFRIDANGDAPPIRTIKGPRSGVKNPTGLFLDTKNNELWVSNFGSHSLTVFRPTAGGDTAPLRTIRSAPREEPSLMIGNPGGLAYDTKREQLLVANWVAHPQIAAFARLANGTAKAVRSVSGQKSLLGRTMHGMAYNPVRDEVIVPQVFAQSILTFRGAVSGEEAPIRVIQGPLTQLRGSSKLEIDSVHNELFVPEGDHIKVFDLLASGNVPPIRVLRGPDTMLGADSVAVDPVHDRLIVVGAMGGEQLPENNRILIFNRTAQGNTRPLAVIAGPKTKLNGTFGVRVYPPTGFFAVSADGPDTTAAPQVPTFVGVWSIRDNGDVAPRYTIGGPYGMLKLPRGIDFDPKNKAIIVSDKLLNAVLTYSVPEIF